MQEFCPECQKNGLRTRVKAFQINMEEAVFMCSSEKCIWPSNQQELTFIKRPVGKDWSKTWDEQELKYLKHDPLMDLSTYTPPQTPGTDVMCKDTPVNTVTVMPAANKACNSNPIVLVNKGVNSKEIFKMLNKSKELLVNGTINNSMNSKPKELILRPVLRKITTTHVFTKDKVTGNAILKEVKKIDSSNVAQTKMGISTSTTHSTNNLSTKVNPTNVVPNPLAIKSQVGLKKLGKRKSALAIKEFDFESIKAKSTNVVKKCDLPVVKLEKVKREMEGTHKTSEKMKMKILIKPEKVEDMPEKTMEPVEELQKIEMLPVNKFESNELLLINDLSLHSKDVKPVILDKTTSSSPDTSQALLDSSLSLGNDPNFDEDILTIIDNDDTDLNLEELLAGFSEELCPAVKSEVPNAETDWINDLFN